MRLLYCVLIGIFLMKFCHTKIFHGCRFIRTFYQTHSNVFHLDKNQTSLTIRPLYALSNQSFSTLSIGIIYRLADTYLVPVPLLFECPQSKRTFAPIDCEFTIIDTHSDLSIRITESTRTTTVPLDFQEYSLSKSISIRGAYFKQSTIALRNCRLDIKENLFTSEIFHLLIEFEQKINSPCQQTCIHPQLYECSSITNTCQCHSRDIGIEKHDHLCVDTELGSNCSLTPERCRRICRISDQIYTGKIDHDCQCPLGTQRILSNNMYHCDLPILSECNDDKPSEICPNGYICRQKQCLKVSTPVRVNETIVSLPIILIALLIGSFLIIIILIIGLIKMRSIRCIKFIHPDVLSTDSKNSSPTIITRLSSSCSTLSSSSKSTNKISEKYTKINLYE